MDFEELSHLLYPGPILKEKALEGSAHSTLKSEKCNLKNIAVRLMGDQYFLKCFHSKKKFSSFEVPISCKNILTHIIYCSIFPFLEHCVKGIE